MDDTGVSATTATVKGDNVFGAKSTVPANLAPLLEKVAEDMADEGYGIHISSGVRAISKQVELIKKNCQNPPGSRTCNPKSTCGKTGTSKCPITCMMYNKDAPGVSPNPGTCPHTAGAAVDVWGVKLEEKSTSGWVSCFPDPKESWTVQCKNKSSCNNECQQKLYEIMEKHGFCLWSGEGWHFEKPGKSGNCRGHQ
ncbi:hypothetical protein AMJ57_05440 [Parcubacteria bacterium SG8_24]|nr:MAG: hypothetical protein AMJ57_05440 [Parcubacteria bacterium SG8_24]